MKRLLLISLCLLFIGSFTGRGQQLDTLLQSFSNHPSATSAILLAETAEQDGRNDLATQAWEYLAQQSPKYLPALWESYLRELRLGELSTSLDKQSKMRHPQASAAHYIDRLHLLRRLMGHVLWLEIADSTSIAQDLLANYLNKRGVKVFSCDSLGLGFLTERGDRYIRPVRVSIGEPIRLAYGGMLPGQSTPASLTPDATIITSIPDSLRDPSYPTLAPDGITLYFSAINTNGIGKRDIYMTRQSPSGEYLQPVPLGLPYNSYGDDLLLAFNAEHHLGYLVSDRYAPQGMLTVYCFVYSDNNTPEVPSNDPAILRQYAMLRPYHITQRADVDYSALLAPLQDSAVTPRECEAKGAFVVAPNVSYTHATQFHSAQAASLYNEYITQQRDLAKQEEILDRLRTEYHLRGESDLNLTERILLLEQDIDTARESLQELAIEIRQLESPCL